MRDRETVIQELRGILSPTSMCFSIQTIMDAINLLEAQEPRLMTLDEVINLATDSSCCMWVEPKEKNYDIWFMDYARLKPFENDKCCLHFCTFGDDETAYAMKHLYGKTWRCWTSKPTDNQRKAVPWND